MKNLFIFLAGAAVGSAVTWRLVKDRYERIAQEEIDSVKEVFSKRREKDAKTEEKNTSGYARAVAAEAKDKPDISEYAQRLKQYGYIYDQENKKPEKGEEADMENDRPYIIDPDEFGAYEDYDTISLTYYSDGVLADDLDELVEDIEEVVGIDSLSRFGEYEEDAVHVRNDRLKADYEILRDSRTYEETTGRRTYDGSEAEEP